MSGRRILFVVPTLDFQGLTSLAAAVAQALVEQAWQVGVVALRPASHPAANCEAAFRALGVTIATCATPHTTGPQALWALRRHLREFSPQVVQAWGERAHRWTHWATLSGRPLPGRYAAYYASFAARDPLGTRWLDRWWPPRADALLAGNPWTLEKLRLQFGERTIERVIAPGVARGAIAREEARTNLRHQLQLPSTAQLIGICGPLLDRKRLKDVLWAIDLLHAIRTQTYLVVVGTGPQFWRLERYARQVHADVRTRFLGPRDDLGSWWAGLDAFCLTSPNESISVALLEAMAADVPVVACDALAARTVLAQEATGETRQVTGPAVVPTVEELAAGLVYPLGDRGSLARALQRLLDQPELARRLTRAAAQTVVQHHSRAEMTASFLQAYRDLL